MTMNASKAPYTYLGKNLVLTGATAVRMVESAVGEGLAFSPLPGARNIFGRPLIGTSEHASNLAFAMGISSAGLRAHALIDERSAGSASGLWDESGRRHLPFVAHLFTGSGREGRSSNLDHRAYHGLSDAGSVLLFASGVQDVVDLTVIGHRVAELSLVPVVLAVEDAWSMAENVSLPDEDMLKQLLGDADDFIDCPTPAQRLLFGKTRRRVPNWFHLDLPVAHGVSKAGTARSHELAGQQPYFLDHLRPILTEVCAQYAAQTGRDVSPLGAYRVDDAEYMLIVQGSLFQHVCSTVEHLRARGTRAGCVNLRMFRPFPGRELCQVLSGKKAVTVLERLGPMHDDGPIVDELLSVLDKASQNAANKRQSVFPDLPVMPDRHRPAVFAGKCGTGEHAVCCGDIERIFENMMAGGRRRFHVGIDFVRTSSTYPKQEILLQNIRREYPGTEALSLSGPAGSSVPSEQTFAFRWIFPSGKTESAWFLETLSGVVSRLWDLRVRAKGGQWHDPSVSVYQLSMTRRPVLYPLDKETGVDGLVVPALLLRSSGILNDLKPSAHVVVITLPGTDRISCSSSTIEAIRRLNLQVHVLEAAGETGSVELGAMIALASKSLKVPVHAAGGIAKIEKFFDESLDVRLSDSQRSAILRGLTGVEEGVDVSTWAAEQPSPADMPLALRKYEDHGPPYSRLSQFYDRCGYFYQAGETGEFVADPFQSVPVVPAATSQFASMHGRERLPMFKPSVCTACGSCFIYCPETAIPPIVLSVESLLKTAAEKIQAEGVTLTQLTPPVLKNMAKLAHQIFSRRDDPPGSVGVVLSQALDKLVAQLKPDGDRLRELTDQCNRVSTWIGDFPASVTRTFFSDPEVRMKGSGHLFSVAINPQSCTGCGICAEVCPEEALTMVPQTPDTVQAVQAGFRRWEFLPDTPGDVIRLLYEDPSFDPLAAILLSRNFYMSLSGVTISADEPSEKTMLHLITAVMESVKQSDVNRELKEIEEHISALSEKVRAKLAEALPSADFGALLASVSGSEIRLPLDTVIARLGETQRFGVIETAWVERLVTLIKNLKTLSWILSKGPTGGGRSRYGAVLSASGTLDWAGQYPYNPFTAPVVVFRDGHSAEFVLGLWEGHLRQALDHLKLLRRARLEVKGEYNPPVHDDEIARLSWADLTDAERSMVPPMLLLADSQLLSEQHMSALLGLLSSEYPIKVVLLSRGPISALDVQRGAAIVLSAVSIRKAFLFQSSLATPSHLARGLMEGIHGTQPALFHLLAPRRSASRPAPSWPELFTLALESRTFPSFRFDPSSEKKFLSTAFDIDQNPEPFEQGTSAELTYKENGEERSVRYVRTFADWAFHQPEFRRHFRLSEESDRNLTPVGDFVGLDVKNREDKTPIIQMVEEGHLRKLVVPADVVSTTEAVLIAWTTLKEMAGMLSPHPMKLKETLEEEWSRKHEAAVAQLKADYEAKLREQQQTQLEIIKTKLRDRLMALSGYGKK
jgi:pyruvate-ferredoxin/flavodoxin oxidoreductase